MKLMTQSVFYFNLNLSFSGCTIARGRGYEVKKEHITKSNNAVSRVAANPWNPWNTLEFLCTLEKTLEIRWNPWSFLAPLKIFIQVSQNPWSPWKNSNCHWMHFLFYIMRFNWNRLIWSFLDCLIVKISSTMVKKGIMRFNWNR